MSSMRKSMVLAAAAAAAAIVGLVGGCSGPAVPGTTSAMSLDPSPIANSSSSPLPTSTPAPEQICGSSLGGAVLLDWAPGTVAQFRAYQYGGPQPTVPLAHAFPGLPGSAPGAWCGTKGGPDATRWWAVVVGHQALSAITVTGPGEGVQHGLVVGPPRVP